MRILHLDIKLVRHRWMFAGLLHSYPDAETESMALAFQFRRRSTAAKRQNLMSFWVSFSCTSPWPVYYRGLDYSKCTGNPERRFLDRSFFGF